jgi:hypothetical protein
VGQPRRPVQQRGEAPGAAADVHKSVPRTQLQSPKDVLLLPVLVLAGVEEGLVVRLVDGVVVRPFVFVQAVVTVGRRHGRRSGVCRHSCYACVTVVSAAAPDLALECG